MLRLSPSFRKRTWAMMLALSWFGLSTPSVQADIIRFTTEHVDIDLRFENNALSLGWHDEDNDVEYEANEAMAVILPNGILSQPADPAFSFTGALAGQPIWLLPEVQDPTLVYLGIGTEEIENGIFDNDQVFLNLIAVRGPGQFSNFNSDIFGNPVPRFATSDGIDGNDQITAATSSDAHLNYVFTAAGVYELDLQLSGFINGTLVTSEVTTFVFEAAANAVPAPGSALLVLLGSISGVSLLRRKSKSSQI